MKGSISLLFCLPLLAGAQTLVSTVPQQRTALLEEFTALHCGNCPAAHTVGNNLAIQYGDALTTVAIHGGPLATPSSGQPDFRTVDGAGLWSAFNVTFQPQGMINRGGLLSAGSWSNAIAAVLAQTSPVNIGVSSEYDASSMTLNVTVELYYTGDSPAGEDRIHVALTEDHVIGWQTDYVNGNHSAYDHRHALRDLATPIAGDPVTNTAVSNLVERTYSFSVDPAWNVENSSVVAFVGDANGTVHQVVQVDADGGLTTAIAESPSNTLGLGNAFPLPASDRITFQVDEVATGNVLQIRDGMGRIVKDQRIGSGQRVVVLTVSDLPAGLYYASFPGGAAKKVVVVH